MPVKDMSLKKNSFVFLFLIIFFFKKISFANQQELENIIDYLDALKFFSVSFIQNDGNSLSEGKIYIVVLVLLIILFALFFYLLRIDKKIDSIKNKK